MMPKATDLSSAYLSELAIELGEGGAQLEITDKVLRESLILNVKKQMERFGDALLKLHGIEK